MSTPASASTTAGPAAGKTALVVGGTNGIGRGIAHHLVKQGVSVTIVGRNKDKTEKVAQEIGASDWLLCDIHMQAQVTKLAEDVHGKHKHLDILVVTAGVLTKVKEMSPDGIELELVSNYLWRFQLTYLLRDLLAAAPHGARVLNVAAAGQNGQVHFDDYNFEKPGNPWAVFKASSQAMQLGDVFTVEAQRRWGSLGNGIAFHITFPGQVNTRTGSEFFAALPAWVAIIFTILIPLKKTLAQSGEEHAPLLLGQLGEQGGKLWKGTMTGFGIGLTELTPNPHVANDREFAAKCWDFSKSLFKVPLPNE